MFVANILFGSFYFDFKYNIWHMLLFTFAGSFLGLTHYQLKAPCELFSLSTKYLIVVVRQINKLVLFLGFALV
jgi:hypothetical protein